MHPEPTGLDNKSRSAFWCTIGGKIENGENIEQAASRTLLRQNQIFHCCLGSDTYDTKNLK